MNAAHLFRAAQFPASNGLQTRFEFEDLHEAFEHQQSLPAFRIREENCPIGRYILTRPNNARPLIG
jgi:hypothetical protein